MHMLRSLLNDLLTKCLEWNSLTKCKKIFEVMKKNLISDLSAHYDPEMNIIVSSDYSEHKLGALLLHEYED